MKDFLSQFMNQTEPAVVEKVEKTPKVTKAPKVVTAKTEKKAAPKAPKNTIISPDTVREDTKYGGEGVGESLSAEAFLKSINDKKFIFDKKKNLQIDDQLFTVLNLLKQHEGIKSIATLLNAIIEKYIQDNKVELKKLLSKNPLG